MKKPKTTQKTSAPNVKSGTNPSRAAAPKTAPKTPQPGAPSTKPGKFKNDPTK